MSVPAAELPRVCRVTARSRETRDTVTLALRDPAGHPLPFAAGQFHMLYAFGVGEVPISVSSHPDRPATAVHTVRAVGAVSRALAALPRGGAVGVRGPFGRGWPLPAAEGADVVLVAGGLGLAPLRPALYGILARRRRYGRVVLAIGARGPAELLYRRQLARWAARGDLEVRVTVDHATPDWRGEVGVVTQVLERARFDPESAVAFICGPEVMMRFAAQALAARGVAAQRQYLSLERNMKCAVARCGHCQLGPVFVCREGPVLRYDAAAPLLAVREL